MSRSPGPSTCALHRQTLSVGRSTHSRSSGQGFENVTEHAFEQRERQRPAAISRTSRRMDANARSGSSKSMMSCMAPAPQSCSAARERRQLASSAVERRCRTAVARAVEEGTRSRETHRAGRHRFPAQVWSFPRCRPASLARDRHPAGPSRRPARPSAAGSRRRPYRSGAPPGKSDTRGRSPNATVPRPPAPGEVCLRPPP